MSFYQKHIFFCINQKDAGKRCCQNAGADCFLDYMKQRLQALALTGPGKIRVSAAGCLGRCNQGPVIVIYPEAIWYSYTTFKDIDAIIEQHLLQGEIVARLQLANA